MIIAKANELWDFISETDPISDRQFKVKNDIQAAVKFYFSNMDANPC